MVTSHAGGCICFSSPVMLRLVGCASALRMASSGKDSSNTASAVLRVLTAFDGGYLCEGLNREVYGVS